MLTQLVKVAASASNVIPDGTTSGVSYNPRKAWLVRKVRVPGPVTEQFSFNANCRPVATSCWRISRLLPLNWISPVPASWPPVSTVRSCGGPSLKKYKLAPPCASTVPAVTRLPPPYIPTALLESTSMRPEEVMLDATRICVCPCCEPTNDDSISPRFSIQPPPLTYVLTSPL